LTNSSSNSSVSVNSKREVKENKDVKLTFEPHSDEDRVQRGLSRNSSQHNLPKTDVLQNKDININLNKNDNLTNRNINERPGSRDARESNSNRYKQNAKDSNIGKSSIYNKENISNNENKVSNINNNHYPLSSRTNNDPSSQSISSNHSYSSVNSNDPHKSSVQSVQSVNKEYRSVSQEEGYDDLLSSIKDVLKFKNQKNRKEERVEDDQGTETEDKRTFQTFLTPDGKKIELEGVDERDSM
jgi:hypothetical protein